MHLTRPLSLPRRRAAYRPDARPAAQRERNKRANMSQDAALYSCSCGYVFKAPVTTSVGCPHCGTAQACPGDLRAPDAASGPASSTHSSLSASPS